MSEISDGALAEEDDKLYYVYLISCRGPSSTYVKIGLSCNNRSEARKRLSGVFEDIKHISLHAPYCDAFVMDTPMAELARQPSVGLESRYGARVFSLNNWDEFLAWLDALEANMSAEHLAGVEAAYPLTGDPRRH